MLGRGQEMFKLAQDILPKSKEAIKDLGPGGKDTGVNLKRLPLAKWNNLSIKRMTQWTETHQMY